MTFEEFVGYAEQFAREHGEPGTLSLRHLKRLAGGAHKGSSRPATKRLLEAIFGQPWEQLLASPAADQSAEPAPDGTRALSAELRHARRVTPEAIRLLASQIDTIRELDRRFGGVALRDQLLAHAAHVAHLLAYTVDDEMRRALAFILVDAYTLAGWQSLDQGHTLASWNHYRDACEAARIAESPTWLAHAQAEQAVVLSDTGETTLAAELTGHAYESTRRSAPRLLRAWLAAAHGEALAADGQQTASLRAFDESAALMPAAPQPEPGSPYMALDEAHLARWRGHALARFGHSDAIAVLTDALDRHDSTFVRAETGLRVDLALAHTACGELEEAERHREQAAVLADEIGSVRQQRRLVNAPCRRSAC
jgi:tetratricopeptide (TPR) repeat protein